MKSRQNFVYSGFLCLSLHSNSTALIKSFSSGSSILHASTQSLSSSPNLVGNFSQYFRHGFSSMAAPSISISV